MASLYRTALRSTTTTRYTSAPAITAPIASTSKLQLTSPTVLSRLNSTSTTTTTSSSSSSSTTASTPETSEFTDLPAASSSSSSPSTTPIKHSYFVPRVGKTLSSFPVYTDVRNGGTRTITELRKIQGSIEDLKTDLSIFLADSYVDTNPDLINEFGGVEVNKKPLRPKPGRKLVKKTGNPTYLDPVQKGKVQESGKLKIRGNRVEEVRAFLESRGF